jgi:plastocyanin
MSARIRKPLSFVVALLATALIVATAVVFIAHDGPAGTAAAQPQAGAAAGGDTVPISDFLYKPEQLTVAVGTKVTFTNEDSAPHTATSGQSPAADGVFDTGNLKKGESKAVKLTKAGTFAYYCAIHPFMKATVTVK